MSEQNPNWAQDYCESYDDLTTKSATRGRYAKASSRKVQWLRDNRDVWEGKNLSLDQVQRAIFKTMQAVGLFSQKTFFRDVRLGRLFAAIKEPGKESKDGK